MIFFKHPKLMSDEELWVWVKALIVREAPESNSLDYKASISLKSKEEKIELGKDVSSFANEGGGILLYGVPESDANGVPIPKTLTECGILLPKNLPENVENVLLDTVVPPLPELHIRVLTFPELNGKSILLLYHPESWNKPHMIEGYKDARYYRRGNFRAVVMKEREVEAAYLARKISLAHATDFFKIGDFRPIPKDGHFFRVIICPRFSLIRKGEMLEEQFKDWLNGNPPDNRRGEWVPFLDGWSFLGYPSGNFHGKQYELRLFHNGGFCFTMDLDRAVGEENLLNLTGMQTVFKDMVLPYVDKAFEILRISGPVAAQVSLHNINGFKAILPPATPISNTIYGTTPIVTDSISFVEEFAALELKTNLDVVLKRLVDRLASAFGIWRR